MSTLAEMRRDLERLEFQLRMLRGKLAKRPKVRRCAYCGWPASGYACEAHADLAGIERRR